MSKLSEWGGGDWGGALFGGGGGDPEISYTQSPEQKKIMRLMMPMLSQLFSGDWQAPQYPTPASMHDMLSPGQIGGLQQPFIEAQQQGMELLGMSGGAGSARGGASGTAGAMTGEIMGQMATQVPLMAHQMYSPGVASQYQAQMTPYNIMPGMFGGTMPEAVVNQGGNNMMSMLPLLLMMM